VDIEKLNETSQRRIEKYIEKITDEKRTQNKLDADKWIKAETKRLGQSKEFLALKTEAMQIKQMVNTFGRKMDKADNFKLSIQIHGWGARDNDRMSFRIEIADISRDSTPGFGNKNKQIENMGKTITKAMIFKDLPMLQAEIEKLERL
jgi:hypothetical protein